MRKSSLGTLTEKIAICLSVFFLAGAVSGCSQNPTQPAWKPIDVTHNIADNNLAKLLWYHQNIYIENSVFLGLATPNDKVFVLGSTDVTETSKLNALDIFTGDLVWKSDSRPLFTIFADEEGVYVEEEGIGGNVTKYNPNTGELLWSKDFWDSGGVLHLTVYEGELHVYLSPDKHKILQISDGKSMFSLFPKSPPFFDSGICGIAYQTPIYTSNTIYFRENDSLFEGEICAVDRSTGILRWKSDLGVISNVVASDNVVFALVESGDLLALDPINGEQISELGVSFSNKPFIPYSVHTTSGSFFLAYNSNNEILLVYLGDSHQLYAFLVDGK